MKLKHYIAPSSWASYLINNDASGIDAADRAQVDRWLAAVGLGWPLCGDDLGFSWAFNTLDAVPQEGGEMTRYTFNATPRAAAKTARKPRTTAHLVRLNAQGYTFEGRYFGTSDGDERLYYVERDDLGDYYRAASRAAAIARYDSLRRTLDNGTAYLAADWG